MSNFADRHNQSSNVQWGKLVAGAAVTSGVALLGVAIGSGEVPILSDIADGVAQVASNVYASVTGAISSSGVAAAAEVPTPEIAEGAGAFSSLGNFFSSMGSFLADNAKSLGGSALLAAGLGYFAAHADTQREATAPVPAEAKSRMQTLQMGFAAREDMRRVNAIMESRMQVFGQGDNRQV